jgi:hypothetical protein
VPRAKGVGVAMGAKKVARAARCTLIDYWYFVG